VSTALVPFFDFMRFYYTKKQAKIKEGPIPAAAARNTKSIEEG
jgi:hypothetical protein